MLNEYSDPTGREQKTRILLDAPVQTVWQVWSQPGHIRHWWGPDGFTNTIHKMEVKAGGEWLFTMQGPDGREYSNKTIFRAVIPYKRLVHEHADPNFIATVEFEGQGSKTLLTWHKLYESRELFDLVEIQYRSSEGLKQTIEKLKKYLRQLQ